jgi:NADH-quinone oxidoreductase subunit L
VCARLVDRRAETLVDGAVAALAAGGRSLGRLARRPQTGQLHHYYAQAFASLLVLVVVFWLLR